jgi:hypothetical protein
MGDPPFKCGRGPLLLIVKPEISRAHVQFRLDEYGAVHCKALGQNDTVRIGFGRNELDDLQLNMEKQVYTGTFVSFYEEDGKEEFIWHLEIKDGNSGYCLVPALKGQEQCPICLNLLTASDRGISRLSNCTHRFCHGCIEHWSGIETSCPLCKAPFEQIIRQWGAGQVIVHMRQPQSLKVNQWAQMIPIPQPVQRADEVEVNNADILGCQACGCGHHEDLLMLCDREGCDKAYHTFCLLPALDEVPEGRWVCPGCVQAEEGEQEVVQEVQVGEPEGTSFFAALSSLSTGGQGQNDSNGGSSGISGSNGSDSSDASDGSPATAVEATSSSSSSSGVSSLGANNRATRRAQTSAAAPQRRSKRARASREQTVSTRRS